MAEITILSIELNNFMCHSHFYIKFNKLVTYIGGRNGSGKSAIMLSLGILFGQRARTLERGSGYGNLIKNGCSQAVITVRIRNYRKYCIDKYGSEIVVSKQLRDKMSRLYIGGINGKLRAAKQNELDGIVDAYELRFENPLNFLTQERSKKFLRVAEADVLYDFYYCGTGFKEIHEDLEDCERRLKEMCSRLEETEERQKWCEKEYETKQAMLKKLNYDFVGRLRELEEEEQLSIIRDQEKEMRTIRDNIKEYSSQIDNYEKEEKGLIGCETLLVGRKSLMGKEEGVDINDKDDREIEEKTLETFDEKLRKINDRLEKLEMEKIGVKNEYEEYAEEHRKLLEILKIENEERLHFEKLQENLNNNNINNSLSKKDNAEIGISSNKNNNCDEDKDKINSSNEIINIKKFEEDVRKCEVEYMEEKMKNEENARIRKQIMRQINFLRNSCGDMFGMEDKFRVISSAIKNEKFDDEVIGPVCKFVRLRDDRWFKPISIVLKNSLFNYLIFNKADNSRLYRIFSRVGIHFTTSEISVKVKKGFNNHNDKEYIKAKAKGYLTALDVIDCSNENVLNFLVTMHGIEQIVLVNRREEGHEIMRKNPQNVECVYTAAGDRIKMTRGSLSDYRSRDTKYWFETEDKKLRAAEAELAKLVDSHEKYEAYEKARICLEEEKRRAYEKMQAREALEMKISGMAMRGIDVGEKEEQVKKKVETLARTIEILAKRCEEIQILIDHVKEEQRKAYESEKERKEKLMMAEKRREEIRRQIIFLEMKKNEEILKLRNCVNSISEKLSKGNLNISANKIVSNESDNNLSDGYNNLCDGSNNLCDGSNNLCDGSNNLYKPDNNLSDNNLCDGYNNLYDTINTLKFKNCRKLTDILREKAIIKAQENEIKKMVSKESVANDISNLEALIAKNLGIINKYKQRIDEAIAAIKMRVDKREEVKITKTSEAMQTFTELMSQNGYEGMLIFNHNAKRLEVSVKVHNANVGGSKNTLSGGERSYAAVCFMVSLWHSCTCPVKVLDEFDVFMDVINRKTAVKILLDYFRKTETQGILITPLDTDDLKDDITEIVILQKQVT